MASVPPPAGGRAASGAATCWHLDGAPVTRGEGNTQAPTSSVPVNINTT